MPKKTWWQDVANAFCPTGDKGGIDNSCGRGSSVGHPLADTPKEEHVNRLIELHGEPGRGRRDGKDQLASHFAGYVLPKSAGKQAAVESAISQAVAGQRFGVDLPAVWDQVKAAHPKLTVVQFQSLAAKLHHEKKIELTPFTRAAATVPRPEFVVPLSTEWMYSAQPRR